MPRHPLMAEHRPRASGELFSRVMAQQASGGIQYPLHNGDVWFASPACGEIEAGLLRYGRPEGMGALRELCETHARTTLGRTDRGKIGVTITPGATGALALAMLTVLDPGDEVCVFSPYWPLIPGVISTARAKAIEVPALGVSEEALIDALAAGISPNTAAIYVNSPCNPTGRVFARALLESIAKVATLHDLWIFSDEVYANLVYRGTHQSIASVAPERTISTFSFSKSYGMAGLRCGYLAAPERVATAAARIAAHVWYAPSALAQQIALCAMRSSREWLEERRAECQQLAASTAETLGLRAPDGGAFHFFAPWEGCSEAQTESLIDICLQAGIAVTPGGSCGDAYRAFVRTCFTSCAPPDVVIAHQHLAKLIAKCKETGKVCPQKTTEP